MDDELCTYPFNTVEDKAFINPKGIIQLSLSRLRNSELSDKEIAEYISNFLFMVMNKNNFNISITDLEAGMHLKFIKRNTAD